MRGLLLFFLSCSVASATPINLRVEHQPAPLAIDVASPRFSWQSDVLTPDWKQSAYRLVVATTPEKLARPDIWDSGRIANSASVDISYTGPSLTPGSHFLWQVTTWDSSGHASVSSPSSFDTVPGTWKAKWIRSDDSAAKSELQEMQWVWLAGKDPRHVPSGQKLDLRYRMQLQQPPRSALLHIIARGSYVTIVNGVEVGRHNGWSAFDNTPITNLLHPGTNEIIVHLQANQATEGVTSAAFAAALEITAADGRSDRLTTGRALWEGRVDQDSPWEPLQAIGPVSLPFSTGVDRTSPLPGPDRISTGAWLLRKNFSLSAPVSSAKLYITAVGAYHAYLNGKAVDQDCLLNPGFTDFRKRILYQTYDVSGYIRPGKNVIAALLGGGWHGSPMTWQGIRVFKGPELLFAQLDITLKDGRHQLVISDGSWKTHSAPILSSEIYGGEIYDARLSERGWNSSAFNDQSWPNASESDAPVALLTAQPDLSIRQTTVLHPIAIHKVGNSYIFDMGQNMVGNIALHVTGPRGATVRMRYAERLNPDGSLYTENLRNAIATDFYTLAGGGTEVYTPSFTFHGFRYVELSGYPVKPTPASIEGLVYNSLPANPSIRLVTSSPLLNSMSNLGFWGQRGNFVSIPTDCPQRDERLGWMGDAGVFWRTGTYNFDTASFTHKFMLDITDAQQPSGDFTDVSPDILEWGDGAPGWADAGVLVPYAAWLQYGDKSTLERYWPQMNRFMQFIADSNPAFLRQNRLGNNYADWLAPDPRTPKDLIDTAYWAILAQDMQQMAKALHDEKRAEEYASLYENIRTAYRKAYILSDGSVQGNTQAAYVVTLYAGLEPDDMRSGMTARLVADIEAHNNHLTTGFLATPFLMSVLDENGRSDIAFKLLLQDTYPSWGYMVRKGATTWWERWNGDTGDPSMNSYNHYAFGSVMAWVFRRVAGIDSVDGSGFQHMTIAPHFDPSVPKFKAEYDSPYGTVVTDYDGHSLTIRLPANTDATVMLPGQRPVTIGSGEHTYFVH
jgi:alpha-L-rhamnosidase